MKTHDVLGDRNDTSALHNTKLQHWLKADTVLQMTDPPKYVERRGGIGDRGRGGLRTLRGALTSGGRRPTTRADPTPGEAAGYTRDRLPSTRDRDAATTTTTNVHSRGAPSRGHASRHTVVEAEDDIPPGFDDLPGTSEWPVPGASKPTAWARTDTAAAPVAAFPALDGASGSRRYLQVRKSTVIAAVHRHNSRTPQT